jgi:hypothetical protein
LHESGFGLEADLGSLAQKITEAAFGQVAEGGGALAEVPGGSFGRFPAQVDGQLL